MLVDARYGGSPKLRLVEQLQMMGTNLAESEVPVVPTIPMASHPGGWYVRTIEI